MRIWTVWHSHLGDLVHFQGKQLCHFKVCLPSEWWSTFKEKNLLLKEQFFSVKSRHPHFTVAASSREVNRKSQKLFPFVKMVENRKMYRDTLK